VLAHKIRESLLEQRDMMQLSGEIHMDAAYLMKRLSRYLGGTTRNPILPFIPRNSKAAILVHNNLF
jgi:hypothetical protein